MSVESSYFLKLYEKIKSWCLTTFESIGAVSEHNISEDAHSDLFDTKAPLASPDFTGSPQCDTAALESSNRIIANTEFVQNSIMEFLILVSASINISTGYNNTGWSDVYELTSDTTVDTSKIYYTKSGSTYTQVSSPVISGLTSYYEKMTYKSTTIAGEYDVVANIYNTMIDGTSVYYKLKDDINRVERYDSSVKIYATPFTGVVELLRRKKIDSGVYSKAAIDSMFDALQIQIDQFNADATEVQTDMTDHKTAADAHNTLFTAKASTDQVDTLVSEVADINSDLDEYERENP